MNVLVVQAHPSPDSFNATMCRTAVDALRQAGHSVETISLYQEGFMAAMTAEERRLYETTDPIVDEQVRRYATYVQSADALVFVYPTWWFGQPAILKGWLDRVLVPGVAFNLEQGKVRPKLNRVRHLVGITTYGSPRSYFWVLGDAGRRTLLRAVRLTCASRTRTTWLGLFSVFDRSDEDREKFLAKIARRMSRL